MRAVLDTNVLVDYLNGRDHRLRLPDAIIWATARVAGAVLVTRNTKDVPAGDPAVRVPYSV